MTSELPVTRLQRWLLRHRRPVRAGCVIYPLVLISSAIYSFVAGDIAHGVLATLLILSPIGLLAGIRSTEHHVARQDPSPGRPTNGGID